MIKYIEMFDKALLVSLVPAMLVSVAWLLANGIQVDWLGLFNLVLYTELLEGRFDLWLQLQ